MRKLFMFSCILLPLNVFSGSIYQCSNQKGDTIFQSTPCAETTVKVIKEIPNHDTTEYTDEMVKALSKLSGKSKEDLKDPEVRKAAEILAATDAAKSYAYSEVYSVSSKYCGSDVENALEAYESRAKSIISLGEYYYQVGIQGEIKGESIGASGKELKDSLNALIGDLDQKYSSANETSLGSMCRDALRDIKLLTMMYGD